jgi:hypothetical protein
VERLLTDTTARDPLRSLLRALGPLVLAVLGLVLSTPTASQTPQFEEFHTWTDIATIYNFSERFRYDGDYGLRGLLTDSNWTLLYLRPSVRYQVRPWLRLHGGAALFYNFFSGEDLPELRPWVGVRFLGPRPGGWVISNYFRLEYRAFYLKSKSEWEAGLRGRWQVQATSPRFAIGSAEEFYGLASIEPFFEIGSSIPGAFGDRFRINAGLGRQFNEGLRVELNYLFHKIRLPDESGELEMDDHVLRLRFFYSFNRR